MKYIDLSGNEYEEDNSQDRLLRKLYTSVWGRMLLKPLVSPWISRLGGTFMDQGCSKFLIPMFIRANKVDMSPYIKREYSSYNDFFTREIKPEERMIDYDERHLVSPSDGKISAYRLDKDSHFWVKHTCYNLSGLLHSQRLADKFRDGYAVVIRLTVDNYHRYCYPADGIKTENFRIPGVFHTVNPIACEMLPVYKENTREFTLLRTKYFGDILQMEVGALMVGRICNYHGRSRVRKGEEKGKFEFGGSTVILLLDRKKVQIREGLLEHTENGYETLFQMGQMIGIRK